MSLDVKQQERRQKRQRVSLACDICRKKKVKCDGTKPTCKNCTENYLSCTYTQPERKPKVRKEYVFCISCGIMSLYLQRGSGGLCMFKKKIANHRYFVGV